MGRTKAALAFGELVLTLDCCEGLVVGVLGPWGAGKTSFIQLARSRFNEKKIPVIDFNPWMFSGTEQLVDSFFMEMASALRLRRDFAEIGNLIAEYGQSFSELAWIPLVGPWLERVKVVAKLVGSLMGLGRKGVSATRDKIKKKLSESELPVVVILDDIDRLSTAEIRHVFRLVRLTANFPNLIYILAFDRLRVEAALQEDAIAGRDFLEKILQLAYDLPVTPRHLLREQIFEAIDGAFSGVDAEIALDQERWPDVFDEVIRPLLRNMRDVRRYATAVHGSFRELKNEIDLVDLLGMEAIRVFLPDVFHSFPGAIDGLTTISDHPYRSHLSKEALAEQVERIINIDESRKAMIIAMIRLLFPGGERHVGGTSYDPEFKGRWLRNRRVAHEDLLRLYLERVPGDSLNSFNDVEVAWRLIRDQKAFDGFLRSLDPDRIEGVIGGLEAYQDQFSPSFIEPAVVTLLNLLPELPERKRGFLEFDTEAVVGRVVYRLLKTESDPKALARCVHRMLPKITTLYGKRELILRIGYAKGVGLKLVEEAEAAALETEWRSQVRTTPPERLAEEKDLFRTLWWASDQEGNEAIELPDLPALTLAILKSARSDAIKQSAGSRSLIYTPHLAWDGLINLFGGEEGIRTRLEAVKKANEVEADTGLLVLVEKYLSGWRPDSRTEA